MLPFLSSSAWVSTWQIIVRWSRVNIGWHRANFIKLIMFPKNFIAVFAFKLGQFSFVSTRETWTHGNQPNALWMRGDLNARKPT